MRKVFYSLSICLVLLTPFLYSNELYNGVISAKQIWFYGAMAFLMLVTALDLLFDSKPFTIRLNKIDLALLAFFTYYTIRAATTPYMPLLHNQRWINWGLCVVLYFVVKRIAKIWPINKSHNRHSLSFSSHSWSKTTNDERSSNYAKQMTSNDGRSSSDSSQPNDAKQMTTPDNIATTSFSSILINFLIFSALTQSLWGLLQLYGFLPSFNGYFKITGTFFNPAPYAMYLAVIFPMALGKVLYHQDKPYEAPLNANHSQISKSSNYHIFKLPFYIAFATTIAILLVLPATLIRAAWLAVLGGSLVILQHKYHYVQWAKQFLNTRTRKILAGVGLITVIGLLGSGIYFLKKDSANGKLFIWEVTLGKIAQKPLFGYGIGRFEAEYNNWQAEYFMKHPEEMDGPKGWVAGNTKYAFNEFLEMASETGIIGILLLGGLLFYALEGKKLRIKDEMLTNSSSFIFTFLILLFISFPLYSLPTLIVLMILITLISKKSNFDVSFTFYSRISFHSIATFILIISFIVLSKMVSDIKSYHKWEYAKRNMESQYYEKACMTCYKLNNTLLYNGLFLSFYGKCLIKNEDYLKSIIVLNKAKNMYSDERIYYDLGDAYKAVKDYFNAERSYLYSKYIIPHLLRPDALLAHLYFEDLQFEKAKKCAQKVMNKKSKIESFEERQIKLEMLKIINVNRQ